MKKIRTKITDANEGMHDVRAYRKAIAMLQNHGYKSPRLYHLCLMDSDKTKPYQDALKALCAELRGRKIPCQYRARLDMAESIGLHMHVYLLVEAKYAMPDKILNRLHGEWLEQMLTRKQVGFRINPPRNPMHYDKKQRQLDYISLPPSKPEKLADAIEWISYMYKNRTTPDLPQIYFSSRPSREIIH